MRIRVVGILLVVARASSMEIPPQSEDLKKECLLAAAVVEEREDSTETVQPRRTDFPRTNAVRAKVVSKNQIQTAA